MSNSEVLNEGEGWLDVVDLTDEERQVIESRLEAHRQNPNAAIPWDDVEAKLVARFGPGAVDYTGQC